MFVFLIIKNDANQFEPEQPTNHGQRQNNTIKRLMDITREEQT